MSRSSKLLLLLLSVIVIFGGFLRLYRIEDTLMFQGDQGRDAIVVKNIIKEHDLTLLGPVTSVGNMYLGPFYYYFMAPFLALSFPNPSGPAYGVAILSMITIVLIYLIGKKVFNPHVAIISSFLFAVNAVGISSGRFSWNPNIAPLFALIIYWSCYEMIVRKKYQYLLLASLAFGVLAQLHYMTLLMAGVPIFSVIYAWWKQKGERKSLVLYSLLSIAVFLLTLLPLIAFDLSHDHLISDGFVEFTKSHESDISIAERAERIVKEIQGRSFRIFAQLNQSPNGVVDRVIVYGMVIIFGVLLYLKKLKLKGNAGLILLVVWLLTGVLGTTLYSDTVFDHYLLYLLPGLMLFLGVILDQIWKLHAIGKVLVVAVMVAYGVVNLQNTQILAQGTPSANHYSDLVKQLVPHLPNDSYNIALISESKDYRGMNYRYFLEVSENKPEIFEQYDNLDTLIIIDELLLDDPMNVQIYEIQKPGLTRLDKVIELNEGPRVYFYTDEKNE